MRTRDFLGSWVFLFATLQKSKGAGHRRAALHKLLELVTSCFGASFWCGTQVCCRAHSSAGGPSTRLVEPQRRRQVRGRDRRSRQPSALCSARGHAAQCAGFTQGVNAPVHLCECLLPALPEGMKFGFCVCCGQPGPGSLIPGGSAPRSRAPGPGRWAHWESDLSVFELGLSSRASFWPQRWQIIAEVLISPLSTSPEPQPAYSAVDAAVFPLQQRGAAWKARLSVESGSHGNNPR